MDAWVIDPGTAKYGNALGDMSIVVDKIRACDAAAPDVRGCTGLAVLLAAAGATTTIATDGV